MIPKFKTVRIRRHTLRIVCQLERSLPTPPSGNVGSSMMCAGFGVIFQILKTDEIGLEQEDQDRTGAPMLNLWKITTSPPPMSPPKATFRNKSAL